MGEGRTRKREAVEASREGVRSTKLLRGRRSAQTARGGAEPRRESRGGEKRGRGRQRGEAERGEGGRKGREAKWKMRGRVSTKCWREGEFQVYSSLIFLQEQNGTWRYTPTLLETSVLKSGENRFLDGEIASRAVDLGTRIFVLSLSRRPCHSAIQPLAHSVPIPLDF